MSALTFDANTSSQYLLDSVTYLGAPTYQFTTPSVGGSALGTMAGNAGTFGPDYGVAPKLNGESIRGDYVNGRGDYSGVLDATTRSLFINGVWTIDVSFRPINGPYGQVLNGPLFCASGPGNLYGTWAEENDNYLISVYRAAGGTDIYVMWQSGVGGLKTTRRVARAFLNEWNFISVSMQASATPGKLLMTVHHNGVKMGDWDLLDPPTGASTGGLKTGLGGGACNYDDQQRFIGDIDEVRISSVHRSDADCVTAAGTIVATTGITLSTPTIPGAQAYDRVWGFSFDNSYASATSADITARQLWAFGSLLTGGTLNAFAASAGKWTLYGSSDGVTAGIDATDRWHLAGAYTAGDFVRAAAGSAHSWIVLKSPVMNGYDWYMLISLTSITGTGYVSCLLSKAAFTGGSTTADPTSTDSWQFGMGTSFTINAATTGTYRHNMCLSTAGDFIFFTVRNTDALSTGSTGFLSVVAPMECDPSDLYPIWQHGAPNPSVDQLNAFTVSNNSRTCVGGAAYIGFPFQSRSFTAAGTTDVLSGALLDMPCWPVVTTGSATHWHHRGRLPDIFMSGTAITGSPAGLVGSTVRDGGGNIRYVLLSAIFIPANAAPSFA